MSKPIEWTTTEPQPAKDVRHVLRVRRYYHDGSHNEFPATPSDLAAALRAMPQAEAEQVVRDAGAQGAFDMQSAIIEDLRAQLKEATRLHSEAESSLDLERTLRRADARFADAKLNESIARAERAERERDEARAEQERLLQSNARYSRAADEAIRDRDMALGERSRAQAERDTERACRLENEAELHRANKELGDLRTRLIAALKAERDDARLRCGAALATAATATARADTAAASHLASAGLVAEFRGRLAAAESALDVAQSRAGRAEKLADEALADRDRARASLDIVRHDLRGTRAEVDALRSRLIAAETAAAQREPREYPLAEGSRWSGDSIAGQSGYELHTITSDRFLVCYPGRDVSAPFADVLALAHRRGLV
jgi:chromosome segregation ATPase